MALPASRIERIAIANIDVPEHRLRQVKPWRVETLRREIGDGNQPQQPIVVVAADLGRYTLVFGAHRLAAVDLGGASEIDARVYSAAELTPDRRRLLEITENLNREELTKLERAESLVELRRVYTALYSVSRRGGDRRSAQAKADQSEIFSFSSHAAEMTGMSRRAIEIAVQIVTGLADDAKTRLRGTWLEDHQAGLRQLAAQDADMQHRVLDLLFSSPPEASSVADAIVLAEGRRLPSPAEKLFASTLGNWSRLTTRQRADFLDAHEEAIREHARTRGWI